VVEIALFFFSFNELPKAAVLLTHQNPLVMVRAAFKGAVDGLRQFASFA
jgi:hypothetical protein